MATDVWERTRDGFVAMWRRTQPERAEMVARELEETRTLVLAAQEGGDQATSPELQGEWQGRLRRLLVAHPSVADDLRALLEELDAGTRAGDQNSVQSMRMNARATGNGHVYQAGRDQHIKES